MSFASSFNFRCSFTNLSTSQLTFGPSIDNMLIFFGSRFIIPCKISCRRSSAMAFLRNIDVRNLSLLGSSLNPKIEHECPFGYLAIYDSSSYQNQLNKMVIYLLLLSTLLSRPKQFHRVQSSWLSLYPSCTVLPLHCQGTLHQTKASCWHLICTKCGSTLLILHLIAASCAINCGVVAVSVVWEEFCWAATGTDTSTWSDSSRGLLVDNEARLLATAGAVFVKNILLSGWTFPLSLCFLKLLWETRAETPILVMSIFLLLHNIHNAFVESPDTFFSHLLKRSSANNCH